MPDIPGISISRVKHIRLKQRDLFLGVKGIYCISYNLEAVILRERTDQPGAEQGGESSTTINFNL